MKKILLISSLFVGFYGFDVSHSAEVDGNARTNKQAMVSKCEVCCLRGEETNYPITLTVLFKVEPGEGVCDISDKPLFIARNKQGEEFPIELNNDWLASLPSKVYGQLIYECKIEISLPRGTWTVSGDLDVRYGKTLRAIPIDLTAKTEKIVQGPYMMEIVGRDFNNGIKGSGKIIMSWSDFVPLSHVKYQNDSGKWESIKSWSIYKNNNGTQLSYCPYFQEQKETVPLQVFLWSESVTKKIPIQFDICVGLIKTSHKN